MRSDKKGPLKSDKKPPSKIQKKGSLGYNKKSALLEDAITQMNAGKYGRASSALKDLLALDPLNAEARRLFATLHLRLGSLMSARTAFESLAREALERQDYWLAESLLREYLTAGPRCVPFLEMLGQLYEGKGDVMAAVAEYGKAVEVLLEDPDTDRPDRASELFGKIRSLAPGSPVAFRLAAMFDTVTGQMVQAAPKPMADSEAEPPHSLSGVEAAIDSSPALAMPWEQTELPPAAAAISSQAGTPIIEGPSGTIPPVPFTSVHSLAGSMQSALASDSESASEAPVQDTSSANPMPPESLPSGLPQTFQHQEVSQHETTSPDSAMPAPTVVEESKSRLEGLKEVNHHPIVDMPVGGNPISIDQVEDVPLAITGDVAPELANPNEMSSLPAVADDPAASLLAKVQPSSIDVPVEESKTDLPEEPIVNSRSLQGSDFGHATTIMESEGAKTGASKGEMGSALWAQADFLPPTSESVSPTIEVLKTSSAHPIAEPPLGPAAMPWDQVEEMPEVLSPSVEAEPVAKENVEEGSASSAEGLFIDAAAAPDPSTARVSSFTSSLGLSWEDILAAVAAMQDSPPYPTSDSTAANGPATDSVLSEETSTTQIESSEVDWFAHTTPKEDSFGNLPNDSGPPLSAPMPWEQIEVEDVPILRPDPEPEFGLISADAANGVQDSTLVMPPIEEMHEPVPALSPDFRILSSDATVETPTESLSIHIPVEVVKPLESIEPIEEAEDPGDTAPSPEPTIEIDIDHPVQEGGSEGRTVPLEAEAPEMMQAEPFAEADGVAAAETPLISPQRIEEIDALEKQAEAPLLIPPYEIDRPVTLVVDREVENLVAPESMIQSAVPSDEFSFVSDQPGSQVDMVDGSEAVSASEDEGSKRESKPAVLPAQEQEVIQKVIASPAARPLSDGSTDEMTNEPVWTSSDDFESLSKAVPVPLRPDEIDQPAAEASVPAVDEPLSTESTGAHQEASTAVLEAPRGSGIRILWNDSFSKRVSSGSSGNMLTRWLKKTPDVAPANGGQMTTATGEQELPMPLATVAEEPEKIILEYPSERPVDVAPRLVDQHSPPSQPNKPVTRQAWHRLTRTVSSFIGAGVSTTRSIIVLAGALLTLALVGLAACLALIVAAWLVLEEQPSPSYRMMTTEPQQGLGDSQKNGYFVLLGFGAAPALDPVQAGMDRQAEAADRAAIRACMGGESYGSGSQGASGEVVGKWLKAPDPAAQMRTESVGVKSWVSQAGIGMGRYRQWLSKPFDDRGFGLAISPNCGAVLYVHRLYVAEGFAQDVEAGLARVEADLTAWRTVFGQAKTMPVKMMAGDALNDDLAVVSGLLLRPDLDDRVISRLAKLARPLEPSEQSIRWPMQSEFVLATRTLGEALKHGPADVRPLYGSIAAALPMPKQRRFNAYAQYYEAVGKAAAEGRYADLPKLSHFMRTPPYGVVDVFVNPIESLVGIEPLPTWEMFAGRVLETDARLRLASLQAWLRRTPPEQDLHMRVAKAGQGLYDPFTGYPMLVNMKKGVFYSVGRDMKDNEAEGQFDIVARIPPAALAAAKPTPPESSR